MKLLYFAVFVIVLCFISRCQGSTCIFKSNQTDVITDSVSAYQPYTKCWTIAVPPDTYVRLRFKSLVIYSGHTCSQTYVQIHESGTKENTRYCYTDASGYNWKSVNALSDVNITFTQYGDYSYTRASSFQLSYHIENLICAQKDHFRCSTNSCISKSQVCDRVKDCENGKDEIGCGKGVLAVSGVNVSREKALSWLKNQRAASFGWGKNTHRAITNLFLAEAASFRGQDLEEELMVKQLELQTSVALLRNSSNPISVSELSMFVRALTVTCHNPRRFFGHDLVQTLGERVSVSKSPSPGAYLALCISNSTLTETVVRGLLKLLRAQSKYPFLLDVQAMTLMAVTCAKNKGKEFEKIENATSIYKEAIEKIIEGQLPNGSFGNVYTTALVTQALIASQQEDNVKWNVTSTMRYLMDQLNSSSVDVLSALLNASCFSGRSLVDLETVKCGNITRTPDEAHDPSGVKSKIGGKMRFQYSLYIGDQTDVIHTIYLRMPDYSSAYEVMSAAEMADPKFKFLHRDVSGRMYIYEIAGITNDPEAEMFWLLYSDYENNTLKHHTESPDKFFLGDGGHLIMWYKTARVFIASRQMTLI